MCSWIIANAELTLRYKNIAFLEKDRDFPFPKNHLLLSGTARKIKPQFSTNHGLYFSFREPGKYAAESHSDAPAYSTMSTAMH